MSEGFISRERRSAREETWWETTIPPRSIVGQADHSGQETKMAE